MEESKIAGPLNPPDEDSEFETEEAPKVPQTVQFNEETVLDEGKKSDRNVGNVAPILKTGSRNESRSQVKSSDLKTSSYEEYTESAISPHI